MRQPMKEDTMGKEANTCAALSLRALLSILTAGGISLSIFAVLSCEFFSYRALDGEPWKDLKPPFDEMAEASVGLFGYTNMIGSGQGLLGDSCAVYDDWREISQHKYFWVAQLCSVLAPMLAILGLIQMVLEWCLCRLRGSYFLIRLLFVSAAILQVCTFLAFLEDQYCFDAASQNQCSMEKGALYSVGATAVYLIMACCFIFLNPYRDGAVYYGCFISTRRREHSSQGEKAGRINLEKSLSDTSDEDERPADLNDSGDEEKGYPILSGSKPEKKDQEEEKSDVQRIPVDIEVRETDRYTEIPLEVTTIAENEDLLAGQRDDDTCPGIKKKASPQEEEKKREKENFTGNEIFMTKEDTFPTEKKAAAIVEEQQTGSIHNRSPDFLDMCCGDPFELEKYLAKPASLKPGQLGGPAMTRQSSASWRAASRKIALIMNDTSLVDDPILKENLKS